ncbi:MAG: hypothetical protein AAGG68_05080 [Bacteroidota bacterium]
MNLERGKLFLVLNRLSKKEIKQLEQFLASPYFNQRADLQRLLTTWKKHRGQALSAEELYQAIYPKRKFKEQELRLLMSYLFRLVEQFLVCEELLEKGNEQAQQLAKVRAYQRLKLPKLALKNLQKEKDSNLQNAEYYYEQFQKLVVEYEFSSIENPSGDHQFQATADHLDIAYFAIKLRQTCLSLSHQAVYKSDFKAHFIEEIIAEILRRNLQEIPAIGIYYYIYKTLTEERAVDSFRQLKTLLFAHHQSFPNKEVRDIYVMTINHCIRAMNRGEMEYLEEVLEIYKQGLKQEYLLENGTLSRFTYNNIVRIALKVNDLNWVEWFIHEYKNSLDRSFRTSSFNFSLASLAYARKDYDTAVEKLQHFNYSDVLLNLAAKILLLKIYYEWQAYELLEAHLDAMKNYIQRKKVIGYHQKNYLNIIGYTKQLIQLNFYDKSAVQVFKNAVKAEAILTEKEWLLNRFG